jgi:hypothetical protein
MRSRNSEVALARFDGRDNGVQWPNQTKARAGFNLRGLQSRPLLEVSLPL